MKVPIYRIGTYKVKRQGRKGQRNTESERHGIHICGKKISIYQKMRNICIGVNKKREAERIQLREKKNT